MKEASDRVHISNNVAAIVATYAASPVITYSSAEDAEQSVCELAEAAESTTVDGVILSAALDTQFLLDDYLRIRRGMQADAFAEASQMRASRGQSACATGCESAARAPIGNGQSFRSEGRWKLDGHVVPEMRAVVWKPQTDARDVDMARPQPVVAE